MSNIVTIKPKKGSKKFFSTATQYKEVKGENGDTRKVEQSTYNGERFPNSQQMIRPKFSASKRKWLLRGYEENSEELNELARSCKLRYPKKHPKAGEIISEVDIYDFSDPFFTHEQLTTAMNEGEISLDIDHPKDKILLAGVEADHEFANISSNNPLMSGLVKYEVSKKGEKRVYQRKERGLKLEAIKLFESLTHKKKVKIAYAMNLITGEDVEPEDLDDVLFNAVEDTKTTVDNIGTTRQEFFIKLAKATTEELGLAHMIAASRRKGILRKNKDGFKLFGTPIGKTEKDVDKYFSDPENQEMIIRVEEALKEKQ